MNEIMSLFSSLGTTQLLGVGGVVVTVIGYSGFRVIKKKKSSNRRARAKKIEVKSNITNDAYKGNEVNSTADFDPETYTVNTEDYTLGPKKVSGPILRPRGNDIDSFLNADLPLSGSAGNDQMMRNLLEEQSKQNSFNSSHTNSKTAIGNTQIQKHLTANPESRHHIHKSIDFAKNGNKEKVIENLRLAIEKEPNQNEKLRFATIIKNYSNGKNSLLELFQEYPSFLASDEDVVVANAIKNTEDSADFELAKIQAQQSAQNNFEYKELKNNNIERFSHLQNELTAPKITVSGHSKVIPTLTNATTVPNISTDKSAASDINEVSMNFAQTANIGEDEITNIFKNLSILNSNMDGDTMTQNTKLANEFNNLLQDMGSNEPKSFGEAEKKTHQGTSTRLAYDVWVQWMTTANGNTSFKSSMYKLNNPWTSRKAIVELTENVAKESKNSDGTSAAWSVISVQPFFDI